MVCIQLPNLVVWCIVAFESGCRTGVIVYSDEFCIFWCVLFVFLKMFNSSKKFKHLCSLFVSAYSCWILSFDVLQHLNLVAEVAWSCRAMNSSSFDVCCMCFWKCLIVAKNSNTYAVCSCLHTFAESCRLMCCSIWIWLQNWRHRVERWILHLLKCVVCVFENV